MNHYLKTLQDLLQQNNQLTEQDKDALIKSISEADKQWNITEIKLDRTEKVTRTTAILLEETIEELEHKRKAFEAQNRELEIESSLEMVRTVAMSMNKPDDMLEVCKTIALQLQSLGIKEIRNVQTAIFYQARGTYMNYEFYAKHDKTFVTETIYTNHQVAKAFAEQMFKGKGEVSITHIKGKEVKDWLDYQKTTNVFIDAYLEEATSLSYYWHSLGPVALGISTYAPLSEEELHLFQRFLKVFDLSYRRYLDIEKAAAQAQEARIEASLERMRASAMCMRKSEELITVCEAMYKELTVLGFTHIRNAQIAIRNDTKQSYLVCEHSDYNVAIMQEAPYDSSPIVQELYHELEKSKDALYQKEFSGKKFDDWRKWRKSIGTSSDSRIEEAHSMCFYFYSIGTGHLGISTFNAISNEQVEILKRFRNVFELSYRRYIDVAKAEAQAREAKTELALERVRARTMAMQKSEELAETSFVLFQQFKDLGETSEQISIGIFNEDEDVMELYSTLYGLQWKEAAKVDLDEPVVMKKIHKAWKEQKKSLVIDISGDDLREYNAYRKTLSNLEYREDRWVIRIAFFSKGVLTFSTTDPQPHETIQLLERFAVVFDGTYTRFLDLQKAEAQAREAKIEAALERTRTQSMLMQHSKELDDTLRVFHEQVLLLGINSAFSFLWLPDEEKDRHIFWAAWAENNSKVFKSKAINYPLDRNEPATAQCLVDWKSNEPVVSYHVPPPAVESYFAAWQELITGVEQLKPTYFRDGLYYVEAFMKYGCFGVIVKSELPEEEKKILGRFAIEFERAYTRFLDLQKAEAQAKEAQIEAALEKVRSRSLAMHKSDELQEVVNTVFDRLTELDIEMDSANIAIFKEGRRDFDYWVASPFQKRTSSFHMPYIELSLSRDLIAARESGTDFSAKAYSSEEKNEWFNYAFRNTDFKFLTEERKQFILDAPAITVSIAFSKYTGLQVIRYSTKLLSEREAEILKRFSKVFEQAYTRFLDLQKAEAQARESQIETALERVRSRSMGMQKSEELKEVIQVVYEQFVHLNIHIEHTGFIMDYKARDDMYIWLADKHEVPSQVTIPYFDCAHWNSFNEAKEKGMDFFANHLSFEEKNRFYQDLFKLIPGVPEETLEYYFSVPGLAISTVLLENVGLYIENFSGIPYSDEENATLMRFGKVFQQTYTRFLDLQRAETQALEAIKRASVDRVRAEIASMRTTIDLERIQPLIWNELKTLGVPFIRCGVFIMDEETQQVQTMLSTPDGRAIATLHVPFEFDLTIITNAVQYWRKKEMYTEHWDATAFTKSWTRLSSLRETSMDSTQAEHPPENLYLHLLPFLQGMLYVGNDTPLNDDELQLVQNLADAFATAYARYEDFNKLESANVKIEKTLVDLKQTQAQLVQSEKMASLGELTAGIAHEIQNPLNFVNNFSELNKELLGELNEEIEKGNYEEVKIIAKDVEANEEKINHHGKRADAIVKGMLQHSRTSSATKEPTDINKLADEYLRLAYHGLRAKDNSFNAMMKTDYDESIGNINIIPQDIGRAVLNLITNAFYAVAEKKKQNAEGYEPAVSLSTKMINDKIEITVEDNGNGIPQKVIDKIFQPFFTTKPTGQGTGLGLSLSYDIVKTHGGEIKVNTKEGEGSEFIIQLPVV